MILYCNFTDSPTSSHPFVPAHLADIRPNFLIRAISGSHGLVTGTVQTIDPDKSLIQLKLRHGLRELHLNSNDSNFGKTT